MALKNINVVLRIAQCDVIVHYTNRNLLQKKKQTIDPEWVKVKQGGARGGSSLIRKRGGGGEGGGQRQIDPGKKKKTRITGTARIKRTTVKKNNIKCNML